jgi:hypothetical protein
MQEESGTWSASANDKRKDGQSLGQRSGLLCRDGPEGAAKRPRTTADDTELRLGGYELFHHGELPGNGRTSAFC